MEEANTKEAGVDTVVLFQIFQTFPPAELGRIKWVAPIDEVGFLRELRQLANDILQGSANTLITAEQATI